jgi:ribosomal protein S18 acetylase RimI-like enzyme
MTRAFQAGLAIEAVDPALSTDVLALAAGAWPADEREGQHRAVRELIAAGRGGQFVLLGAWQAGQLAGAALAQKLAGRSAVVWPPQLAGGADLAIARRLLEEMHGRLSSAGVRMAQALLESPQSAEAALLQAAGYIHAGDLLYMAAEAEKFPQEPGPLPFTLEAWSPQAAGRLERVVEATYRGSLDCPLVDRLQETADALAGYRAVGRFRPELWHLVREGPLDVGCLLLADHPAQQQWEIVYLGLVPEARGRGWGAWLTRYAQWLAGKAGAQRLVLAVDAANRPAIGAYEACGFFGWGQRRALVRSLRS